MGSFTLAVESTARDVNALLALHRVHPQVRADVQRLLQHLVKKSYEHMQSLQPGFEESSDQICRVIATDIVNNVVSLAIPASQLGREEEQCARYYQELQDARAECDALVQQQTDTQIALTDLKKAHDYMLHSYFHEVLILRQRISDLQLQQKKGVGLSGLSGSNTGAGSLSGAGGAAAAVHRVSYSSVRSTNARLSTSLADGRTDGLEGSSRTQMPPAVALSPSSSFHSAGASAGATTPCHLGDVLGRGGFPPATNSSAGASTTPSPPPPPPLHKLAVTRMPSRVSAADDGAHAGGRNSIADVSSPPTFMKTAQFGSSAAAAAAAAAAREDSSELTAEDSGRLAAPEPCDTTSDAPPLASHAQRQHGGKSGDKSASRATSPGSGASLRNGERDTQQQQQQQQQMMMLYTIAHPNESVDAVFDYERYVSLLNGPSSAWDDRYVELIVAKEAAEELVTKERSKRRVGFQFARAERRDRMERMEHEMQIEQTRSNKWWWAQKLALEEVRRDYAERIAIIKEEMENLRSTMLHDYMFNLQQAMSLLQSRIDVLLNFFLVYIKATDETVRTIQRDARARSRADLLITDHHAQHSSTAITSFFENPENERERPNIASELIRLQDEFWRAEEKQTKNAEAKDVHPLYLSDKATTATATATSTTHRTQQDDKKGTTTSGKAATEAFRAKAHNGAPSSSSPAPEPSTATTTRESPGETALDVNVFGESVQKSVSCSPAPPQWTKSTGTTATSTPAPRPFDDGDARSEAEEEEGAGSPSPTPSTYKTDGLPYWEHHPVTASAQKVFDGLQGLARKLRLRKAVQLENEIRITSARGRRKERAAWRDRLHDGQGNRTRDELARRRSSKRSKSTAQATRGGGDNDDDGEEADNTNENVVRTLTESAAWGMQDGWEDAAVAGDDGARTARELLKELVQLRLHRIVQTVRRRTTLQKLQDILDVVDDTNNASRDDRGGGGGGGGGGERRNGARSGSRVSRAASTASGMSSRARRRRTKENILSIDHLRAGTDEQDLESDEELDIRIAMLSKVCEVAEDRIQDDTLRINALLRLLRDHKLAFRDWEKERKETDEERAERLAREKAEREAHLARLLQSPYWKTPPQKFYGQGGEAVSFLPAGLVQARQRPLANYVVFQGEKIPINAFLQQQQQQQVPRGGEGGEAGMATTTTTTANSDPSLASRIVTRGQKRTPYAAVMDYCQGVQLGLPMSDRRGPIYLQYDASKDAYYVADDEGTDLVLQGQQRLTQLFNSARGGGDASANNIFNAVNDDDDDDDEGGEGGIVRGARLGAGGRALDRWTVPMTQVLFPAPAPAVRTVTATSDPNGCGTAPTTITRIPGTQRDGTYVYITDPNNAAPSSSLATPAVVSAEGGLAPLYLVPMTLPVAEGEQTLFGADRTRDSVLYTTADNPQLASATPYHLLDPENPLLQWWWTTTGAPSHAAQLESIWRAQPPPSAPAHQQGSASAAATTLARPDNAYYHSPPMVFRPPTEEQRMLAIAGLHLAVPTDARLSPQPAKDAAPRDEDVTIRYDGQHPNYMSLFPPGSTFYTTGSSGAAQGAAATATASVVVGPTDQTSGDAQETVQGTTTHGATAAPPPTSIIDDPLRAAATSIAKARQLREQRTTQARQNTENAQLQRRQEWCDRVLTQEPTEREKFLRLRLPHLAPLAPEGTTAVAAPGPSTAAPAPSLASVPLTTTAPTALETMRLQQQLRAASHNKAAPSTGRDVIDKRTLTSTTSGATPALSSTMPTRTTTATTTAAMTTATTGGEPRPTSSGDIDLPQRTTTTITTSNTELPLRLPPEFVQVTQARSTADSTGRPAVRAGHGASRKSRKLDGSRFA